MQITLLKRSAILKEHAQVVRSQDAPKVCPFSKVVPKEELWKIVDEILKKSNKKV